IVVLNADTRVGSAGSSSASRQTYITGGAVKAAAEAVCQRVLGLAQSELHPASEMRIENDNVVGGDGRQIVTLATLLGDAVIEETREFHPRATHRLDPETGQADAHMQYAFAAHRAVVDVDTELGLVKVVELATAQDVGKAINPLAVQGHQARTRAAARLHPLTVLRKAGLLFTGSQEIDNGWVLARDGMIAEIGSGPPPAADEMIDEPNCLAMPGLVNAHDHMYQWATRGYVPDGTLFEWLRALYPVWARIDADTVRVAARAAIANLLLSGCTLSTDHHYVFPHRRPGIFEALIDAAREL